MAYALPHRGQVVTASALDVLAAIWLIISPFVLVFHYSAATGNNVVLGIVIGVLALARFIASTYQNSGLSWINLVLGCWVIASPWALRFDRMQTAMVNNVIMGIIVVILSFWSAMASSADRSIQAEQTPMTRDDLR
jgi:SPW repeat-containing protein